MRLLACLATALLVVVTPAAAGEPILSSVLDEVGGHPGVTFADLLIEAVPTLALRDDVLSGGPAGPFAGWDGATGGTTLDVVDVGTVMSVHLREGGKDRLAVLATLGESEDSAARLALLALFDDSPRPRLLEAIDAGLDRQTWMIGTLAIGPGDDAIVVRSEHSNSSQTYDATAIGFLRDGRFQLIDTIFTFGDRGCGHENWQELTFPGSADDEEEERSGEGTYWPVQAVVTVSSGRTEEACGDGMPHLMEPDEVKVTYSYSASLHGYVADSNAFAELAEKNAERF